MAEGHLDSLEPELIGGIFGRRPSLTESSILGRLEPRTRVIVVTLAGLLAFLTLVGTEGELAGKSGLPSALLQLIHRERAVANLGLSLSQDPVGVLP